MSEKKILYGWKEISNPVGIIKLQRKRKRKMNYHLFIIEKTTKRVIPLRMSYIYSKNNFFHKNKNTAVSFSINLNGRQL